MTRSKRGSQRRRISRAKRIPCAHCGTTFNADYIKIHLQYCQPAYDQGLAVTAFDELCHKSIDVEEVKTEESLPSAEEEEKNEAKTFTDRQMLETDREKTKSPRRSADVPMEEAKS